MKKGVLLVVVLLALSSLLAAAAYTSATVTNDGTMTVSTTDEALLAFVPNGGVGNLDETAYVDEDGILHIDFGRGNNPFFGGDQLYGLQPNSKYIWWNDETHRGMFTIQNRSAETIKLYVNANGIPEGVKLWVQQGCGTNEGWQLLANGSDIELPKKLLPRTLGSGWSCDIGFKVAVEEEGAVFDTSDIDFVVKAEAVDAE